MWFSLMAEVTLVQIVVAASSEQDDLSSSTLKTIACEHPDDCEDVSDGTYCDLDLGVCTCKPDYPLTDTNHCYKVSKRDEFCRLDIQCQRADKNSRCNLELNVCQCKPRFKAQAFSDKNKTMWCVEEIESTDNSQGSYYDPALFGIMGGLALMFIVMCVVLQLFAKAQFRENRTIFNTPNPRLMNVSLMKDNASTKDRKISTSAGGSGGGGGGGQDDGGGADVGGGGFNESRHLSRKKSRSAAVAAAGATSSDQADRVLIETET